MKKSSEVKIDFKIKLSKLTKKGSQKRKVKKYFRWSSAAMGKKLFSKHRLKPEIRKETMIRKGEVEE